MCVFFPMTVLRLLQLLSELMPGLELWKILGTGMLRMEKILECVSKSLGTRDLSDGLRRTQMGQ
ncbi:hypothetical protein LINPERHAP2_LOCUS7628 [Linum perenne]